MNKTAYYHDWAKGHYKVRTLSRSFDTLEAAERFSEGKQVTDIYRKKGRYTVEWTKEEQIDSGRKG